LGNKTTIFASFDLVQLIWSELVFPFNPSEQFFNSGELDQGLRVVKSSLILILIMNKMRVYSCREQVALGDCIILYKLKLLLFSTRSLY
jgi:hypothetical protein